MAMYRPGNGVHNNYNDNMTIYDWGYGGIAYIGGRREGQTAGPLETTLSTSNLVGG